MNNAAMFKLTYGLFVLTAKDGDKDNGCIINTAMQVTAEPNRIIIVVNKQNYTHDMIMKTKEFNVSMIDTEADFELFKHFGFQSGRDVDKMSDVSFSRSKNGVAYLNEMVNGYISGKVISTTDLGSHTMFLADVVDGDVLSDYESVTYSYYHKNIKPAPQPVKKKGWICKICGYVYEGEELPPDFICPICKHPASDFEQIQ
ncbi:MAG: flavin reductase [Faecalicatena sp.]|uniref:flavin reductase n=1 Tax=Faecalicatena sp. TaxID=2005360 RepID=UPI00258CC7C4|nr:flavin reductase [Faecalicatena sp.]MCI6467093.1 flavin reductase [Faecalicatena sp.]MDY5618877.1 flavin reductase [Lachnospiraceae bacterium]